MLLCKQVTIPILLAYTGAAGGGAGAGQAGDGRGAQNHRHAVQRARRPRPRGRLLGGHAAGVLRAVTGSLPGDSSKLCRWSDSPHMDSQNFGLRQHFSGSMRVAMRGTALAALKHFGSCTAAVGLRRGGRQLRAGAAAVRVQPGAVAGSTAANPIAPPAAVPLHLCGRAARCPGAFSFCVGLWAMHAVAASHTACQLQYRFVQTTITPTEARLVFDMFSCLHCRACTRPTSCTSTLSATMCCWSRWVPPQTSGSPRPALQRRHSGYATDMNAYLQI